MIVFDYHCFVKAITERDHFIGSKSSSHYLRDTNRFDFSSKGPSSNRRELVGEGGGIGEITRVFIQVNILKQHVTK